MKGGYQVIDCKGANLKLGGSSVLVAGIFERIGKLDKNKPVIIENVTLSDDEDTEESIGSIWVNVASCQTGYLLYVYWHTSTAYISVHRDSTIQIES